MMKLEEQLESLARLGLKLNEGVTVDDLLYSYGRDEYENDPFDLIFFMLGSEVEREPWGRNICDHVWNFDVESICDTGSYVEIVQNFCRIAEKAELITDLEDFVDIENGKAWLKYVIDGERRYYNVTVNDDWAEPETVSSVMTDIERDGKRFYAKDNGQASIWIYLDDEMAGNLNRLANDAFKAN